MSKSPNWELYAALGFPQYTEEQLKLRDTLIQNSMEFIAYSQSFTDGKHTPFPVIIPIRTENPDDTSTL